MILWDVEEGVPTETLEGHAASTDEQHAFSPDGRTLYTAGNDGRVIVWDVAGDRRLGRPFPRGLGGWGPGRSWSACVRAQPRRTRPGRREARRPGGADRRRDAAQDGELRGLPRQGGGGDRLLSRWTSAGGGGRGWRRRGLGRRVGRAARRAPSRSPGPSGALTVNPRTVSALAFGQGDLLAAAEVGGAVRIWDVGRRELLRPPLRLPASVLGLAFSPDGSQLAIPFGAATSEPKVRTESRSSTSEAASGLPGFPPAARSARLPSPPTAACSRVARSTAARSSGRPTAGGGWDVRSLSRTRPLSEWSSPRTGTHLRPRTRTDSAALWDVASQEPIGPLLPEPDGEPGATAR